MLFFLRLIPVCISLLLSPDGAGQTYLESVLETLAYQNRYWAIMQTVCKTLEQDSSRLKPEQRMYYHTHLCRSYHVTGNFRKAKHHAHEAIAAFPMVEDSSRLIGTRLAFASASHALGERKEILPQAEEIRWSAERLGNKKLMRDCYNLLGTIYFIKEKKAERLEFKKAALEIRKTLGLSNLNAVDEISYGLTWLPQDADSSLAHLEKGRQMAEKLGDSLAMAYACTSFGYYHLLKNDLKNWTQHITSSYTDCCSEARLFK
ncbi:MAG: hypothetical protein RLY31_2906 [Bacteroidota bacterium]|jgi:tetratricopeptide (TPR) repeat protein